jgi:hypothetical protein
MLDLPDLPKYFPPDRGQPCYAVYGTPIDRFVLVDSHELSVLVRASMLFSSKMVSVVCVYDGKSNPPLTNASCMNWAPVHRLSQANSSVTTVLLLEGAEAIVEKGPVASVAPMIKRAQDYLAFTVRVLYAQFMANATTGHADLRMFRTLIPEFETLPGAPLSGARQLFPAQIRDQRIEEILYYSDTIEQAKAELDSLLANRDEPRLPNVTPPYYREFNTFLYGQPTVPS